MKKWVMKLIEKAVIDLFNNDRTIAAAIGRECPNLIDHLDVGGTCDIALDLLGIPPDNTVETGACDHANATGEWPEWGYCRDSYWDMWTEDAKDGKEFLGYCHEALRSIAENPIPSPPKEQRVIK